MADGTNGTPDLRGTFIRGMKGDENGRDEARSLGSFQDDALKNHRHWVSVTPHDDGNGSNWGNSQEPGLWANAGSRESLDDPIGYSRYTGWSNQGADSGVNSSNETRPKNIALLYCVKE